MGQKKKLDHLVQDIFREASEGQLFIAKNTEYEWRYYSRFYSNIEGEDRTKNKSYPTVRIRNYDEFLAELDEYLKLARDFYEFDRGYQDIQEDHDFDKFLILTLFANADYGDLQDMTKFVQKRSQILKNKQELTFVDIGEFGKYFCQARTTKNQATLEAPYSFTPHIYDEERGEEYVLPSVTFGVTNNGVVVYAVQGRKNKQTNKVAKDMSRYFRKVNEGALMIGEEDDDSLGEFAGTNLRKDILNVSPFALVSLTMFFAQMKKQGERKIAAPALLPIRYIAGRHATFMRAKVMNVADVSPYIQKREDIQKNATDNFMHLFARYCFHFHDSEFDYDDMNQRLELEIREQQKTGKNILFEIDKMIEGQKEIQR